MPAKSVTPDASDMTKCIVKRRNWEQRTNLVEARVALVLKHRLATACQLDQDWWCGEDIVVCSADGFHDILHRP